MKINKLRDLKIKLANLQLEIQYLIDKGENEPGLIDAIAADISEFTDEVTKIRKEIASIKNKKIQKESISLVKIYEEIQKEDRKKKFKSQTEEVKKGISKLKDIMRDSGYDV